MLRLSKSHNNKIVENPDNFTNIKLTVDNLDRFIARSSIFKALKSNTCLFHGRMIDIGCGKMPYKNYLLNNSEIKEYIGLDIETALSYDAEIKPDFIWNGIQMPFERESFDCSIATEVLEHCPDPALILRETCRVLKPGGIFFFTVPFLWPLHETPHDEFRYTPWSMKRLLEDAGFEQVVIKPTGGWHASMAQMLGLWVKRSPMGKTKRILISRMLFPVIKRLIRKDLTFPVKFKEGQMITGLSGTAKKKRYEDTLN